MQIGLAPSLEIGVIVESPPPGRVERLSLAEITSGEFTGPPMDLAELMAGIDPITLSQNAQLLAAALADPAPPPETVPANAIRHDSGDLRFLKFQNGDGVIVIHVDVHDREGETMISTAGTRWNLHGVESFENGTSLYLHHLDNPTAEQRIILWPPDRGTFNSFTEATNTVELQKELNRRDARWTRQPAKVWEASLTYLKQIFPKYRIRERDPRAAAFGDPPDPHRFQMVADPNPPAVQVLDRLIDRVIFDLVGTEWQCLNWGNPAPTHLQLRYGSQGRSLDLAIDWEVLTAGPGTDPAALPLGFVHRQLVNYQLHENWELLLQALTAGPTLLGKPEYHLPAPAGFQIELWSADPRIQLPYLQPRILGQNAGTLLDLRDSHWGARTRTSPDSMTVNLHFFSAAPGPRQDSAALEVDIDLVTHRVTSPHFPGWMPLGRLQEQVRNVRGEKWLLEDLPVRLNQGLSVGL